MEEMHDRLVEKVQTLSDLEIAVLICLVAEQHCIFETEAQLLDTVESELKLILDFTSTKFSQVATHVFGLTWAVLECNEQTTLDHFGCGILAKNETSDDYFNSKSEASNFASLSGSPKRPDRRASKTPNAFTQLDSGRIANIVIAKNLDRANSQVQTQALELMRGKRNFTRTAVYAAPRPFLLVALNELNTTRLSMHLNDQFFMSHKHNFEDSLPNLEEQHQKAQVLDDDQSTSSVIRTPPFVSAKSASLAALFSAEDLATFNARMAKVKISSEVRAYLHNIVVFMRLHRAVAGGISALSTRHFSTLAYALAPLHGLDYISPSTVALAARKIYPHRIVIIAPENERSLQWGSSLEAVKAVLDGVTADDVVEEVLQSVEVPL
ncbi:uncharacterized protein M421DRAFT_52318 [Didymella exigua CBS 183.55]|uniref:magnesium chelatase n=1 Tax=Didymella exigua CBS 183.55 TaxID=1150837 RepID=A0A6A5RY22_9PLEO|nr:uncharacterized protein M421DRAFT_52318 [Didymella exigua CBS 183.55]KAF1933301.1 hypothetical protein M421DRAFT_52318 [Didymella exigua CBS 183.55]